MKKSKAELVEENSRLKEEVERLKKVIKFYEDIDIESVYMEKKLTDMPEFESLINGMQDPIC